MSCSALIFLHISPPTMTGRVHFERRDDHCDWHFEGLGTSYRVHVTWKMHSQYTRSCIRVQVSTSKSNLATLCLVKDRSTYYVADLWWVSVFLTCNFGQFYMPHSHLILYLYLIVRISNWNLAHEPEFVREEVVYMGMIWAGGHISHFYGHRALCHPPFVHLVKPPPHIVQYKYFNTNTNTNTEYKHLGVFYLVKPPPNFVQMCTINSA